MEFALPTFIITLREGVEAALVVGIVMAYLQKMQRSHLNAWVYAGIITGILLSGLVGFVFHFILQASDTADVSPIFKPLLEGMFTLVAIAMLSWMLIWMTQQGKFMKTEMETSLNQTLGQSDNLGTGWSIFSLILFAVLREGFEIVIFITAKFQEGTLPVLGAIAGLICSVLIGVGLFKFGIKINIGVFFRIMGFFLLLIVAGLVISTLGYFDKTLIILAQSSPSICVGDSSSTLSGSCILGRMVWDLSEVLPQRQFPGLVLRALFGYTDKLYLGQAIAYLGFLFSIGTIYFRSLGNVKILATPNT